MNFAAVSRNVITFWSAFKTLLHTFSSIMWVLAVSAGVSAKQHLQNPLLGPQRTQRTFWVFWNWHIYRMKVGDGSQKDTILYSNYSEQEERLQTTKFPVQDANNQCSWVYWLATSCKFAPEFSLNSSHSCCLTNVFCRSEGTCTLPQQFKRQDNYLKEITLCLKNGFIL